MEAQPVVKQEPFEASEEPVEKSETEQETGDTRMLRNEDEEQPRDRLNEQEHLNTTEVKKEPEVGSDQGEQNELQEGVDKGDGGEGQEQDQADDGPEREKQDQEERDEDDDEDEDSEDDNIKVTIEDIDVKTIQKQEQPTKKAAPLVLETNQEPIDINLLDDKPWRKPGADINDYFNYGFDETTWRIYCDKQKQMKAIADEIMEPQHPHQHQHQHHHQHHQQHHNQHMHSHHLQQQHQETFKIPVVNAAPLGQPPVMPYIDERLTMMDSRGAPLLQPQHQHHQPHPMHSHQQPHSHARHNQHPDQRQSIGSSDRASSGGRIKVEEDVKKYDRRHDRSSERRQDSKSRERRHSKSRDRERERDKDKDKDKERKRSRSRERERRSTKGTKRPRSRSREDDRRSRDDERRTKSHRSSRHA